MRRARWVFQCCKSRATSKSSLLSLSVPSRRSWGGLMDQGRSSRIIIRTRCVRCLPDNLTLKKRCSKWTCSTPKAMSRCSRLQLLRWSRSQSNKWICKNSESKYSDFLAPRPRDTAWWLQTRNVIMFSHLLLRTIITGQLPRLCTSLHPGSKKIYLLRAFIPKLWRLHTHAYLHPF